MHPAPLLAVSLVGVSCATIGRLGGGGGAARPPERSKPSQGGGGGDGGGSGPSGGGGVTMVSQSALGPLTVTRWNLGNGLGVILVPDPAATSVSYTTWFRVGSRHEDAGAGETGLAHLFEHLMFTQTRGMKEPGEFDRRMEEVGGNVNAMTSYDFTAYLDNVPPSALPVAIALEADRMVNLALTRKQVETERDVVAEERLSVVEDDVDGQLDEAMYAQAFKTHPYRFPVIGLMKDIKAFTQAKAEKFYRTFYAPNNAVVVVAGQFDAEATLAAIQEHYGRLSPSRLPADRAAPERPVGAAVARAEVSEPVPADRLVVGLPAPALSDPDRAAYEVMAELLAGGPSSRLYRRLVVDSEMASSVNGDVAPTRDPGLFALWVQMKKGKTAPEGEKVIEAELGRLVNEPVPAAELDKARTQLETAFWAGLTGSGGKAERLGEFEISAGDHRRLLARGAEYGRVTAADVARVARAYVAPGGRSIVVARPRGE